jgi:ribosomal protein L14
MEILKIRPARVQAALVSIGDMLVTSPLGADGPRESRWIGAVTEHIIVTERPDPDRADGTIPVPEDQAPWWRQWRIGRVDGENVESAVVPADGWVWVHLPEVTG